VAAAAIAGGQPGAEIDRDSQDTMDQLIIKSLQGEATPGEVEWLRRWRAESPENDGRYIQIKRLWELTEVADPRMSEPQPDVDVLIRLASASGSTPSEEASTVSPMPASDTEADGSLPADQPLPRDEDTERRQRSWLRRVGFGAVAAALVAVGFGLAGLPREQERAGPFAESEVVTGEGEMTTVTLHDGSSIRMGPNSRLNLAEDASGIVAHLAGRAFFAVHADPSRRFRVIADHGAATVFGTRFEVRSEDEAFRVMVLDGKVRVSSSEGTDIDLLESEMSLTQGDAPPTKSRVNDVYAHLDWMGNALVFQGTRLGRAAAEIGRHYGVDVVLEDPALADLTVSVTLTGEELQDALLVVCEIVGARFLMEEGRVRIFRDAPATEA